ncbi:MAG: DUF2794 domain-containing protein [Phaeospirillum sp.]|nr:DUF2794 domain-containing protein [Phaeospirillum sp.]
MASLIRMAEYRADPGFVQFERAEINQLLALYAARVADGEWRDYAIDLRPDRAVFSVFRHTLDRPLFTIAKEARNSGWVVRSGRRELARSRSLTEALACLAHKPPHLA